MLILALSLVGAALLLALLCPRLLTLGNWQLLHPRVALTAWFGSFAAGVALAIAGLSLSVAAAVSSTVAEPRADGVLITAAGWIALGVLGAAIAVIVTFAESLQPLRPDPRSPFEAIAYAREERIGFTLVRFRSEVPEAYAVPGRRPEIFVSSAMERLLTKPQLQAVLAHEFAHLRHLHGLALRIAQLNALCLPGTRAGVSLERVTRLQIELAADDAAARQVGAAHLANALVVLAEETQDVAMRLRAQRLARKRWPAASRRRLPQGLRLASRLN
ncbi:M56 family metallopeptidase [Leucobacter sp. wl10]|uniref:M56 family metallopeptidase n=1 Tax=Leucobacter sp. wl10 TaxID=2304677 RepID=UPI000E5B6024|nr:M56 family metallopeptidase [Leucobacter sp. wl10]RGE21461.1 M56 family peptidase [Leucobacter sp. wl10]